MLSLFSSRDTKVVSDNKTSFAKDCMNCIKQFSGRVSFVLGLTMASGPGFANTSIPDVYQDSKKISSLKNPQKDLFSEKFQNLYTAKAEKGDSVSSFMLKNFGTTKNWEGRLLNIKTGEIVLNSYTDLKAGETYILTKDSNETMSFISLFNENKKVIKTSQFQSPRLVKQPKLTYNSFAAPEEDFLSIARKVGIPKGEISNIITLAATLGHQESRTNYNEKGEIIDNIHSKHYGTCATGRYQIMEKNWKRWSMAFYGEKLSLSPENQDRVAFSQIANLYFSHYKKGLDLSTIIKEVGKDWYGRGPVKEGHPTPTQYATTVVRTFDKFSKDFSPKFSVVVSDTIVTPKATSTKIALAKKASPQKNTPKPTVIAANEPHFDKETSNDYTTDFIFDGKQVVSLKKGSREDKLAGKIYKEKMLQNLKNDPNFASLSNKFENFTKASDFVQYYRDNIRHFEEKGWDTTKIRTLFSELRKDIVITTQQTKNDSKYELKKAA